MWTGESYLQNFLHTLQCGSSSYHVRANLISYNNKSSITICCKLHNIISQEECFSLIIFGEVSDHKFEKLCIILGPRLSLRMKDMKKLKYHLLLLILGVFSNTLSKFLCFPQLGELFERIEA
jgi:hypothetical protein